MITLHAKSPCCGATVRRFGQRRRQCTQCHQTWRIRVKKRGRPQTRIHVEVLHKVLLRRFTLCQLLERRSTLSLPAFRYRFRQTLQRFVKQKPVHQIPQGPLILLADGMRFKFSGKVWVLYLTALKSCHRKEAVFLDPLLISGMEGAKRWEQVFAAIPTHAYQRICGLVSDNLRGMQLIARRRNWVLQLCQFHMIYKLQFHRRGLHRKLKGGKVREEIYLLIRKALILPDGLALKDVLDRLRHLTETSCGTRRMRLVVLEFLYCIDYYRAFETHPDLGLPSTNNTMESMGSIVRDALKRSHAASNPKSLLLWATALLRLRPATICNNKRLQPN